MLERLESRETPNSLYNPLFESAFPSPDPVNVPYAIVPAASTPDQGNTGGAGGSGASQAASPPSDDFSAADSAFAATTTAIDLNAHLFDSMLGNADASFAASVAASVGGTGRTAGVGAAVVVGLPAPTAGSATNPAPATGANPPAPVLGSPPAVYAPASTAAGVGVSLSPSEFGTNPFSLRSGATISALTPFVVHSATAVPAPASGGVSLTTGGVDANNIGYTTTTTDSFSLAASLAPDAAGGQSYTETYTFTYDVQTVPRSAGGAAVHDWGASGYTFLANNDNGAYRFTLVATLSAFEAGSRTQTSTAADGSTNTMTTAWQSQAQYQRTIDNSTSQATGATTGDDSGGGLFTWRSTGTGTYGWPMTGAAGVGIVSGAMGSYAGQGKSYQFATTEGRDTSGAVTLGGTWDDGNGGYNGDWYSGGGTYTLPSTAGGDPNAFTTGGGTYKEWGADSSGYGYGDHYGLQNDGSWLALSGSGSGGGVGYTQTAYSASGAYGYGITGGAVVGTWQQDGGNRTSYTDATTSTLNGDGTWTTTGTGGTANGGVRNSSYQGAGTYTINPAPVSTGGTGSVVASTGGATGGPGVAGATVTGGGVTAESGSDSWSYGYVTQFNLGADGSTWQAASGAGSGGGSGFANTAYSGSGNYGYSAPGLAVDATWRQAANDNTAYTDATASTLNSDGSWTTTGTWNGTDKGGKNSSYQGAGVYVVNPPAAAASPSADGTTGAVASNGATSTGGGVTAESGSDAWNYAYASRYTLGAGGAWQAGAGSGSGGGSGFTKSAYSGSGNYNYALVNGAVAGTWQQGGNANTAYTDATSSVLNSDGSWMTIGNWNGTNGGAQTSSYQGAGAYTINPAPANVLVGVMPTSSATGQTSVGGGAAGGPGVAGATVTGAGVTAESGTDSWSYGYSSQYNLGANGAWQAAGGSGQGGGSGSADFSSSASGAYGYGITGGTVGGTWQQTTGNHTAHTDATTSTLNSDGTWATAGTAASSGSGSSLSGYTGTGSYVVNSGVAGGPTVSGNGTMAESGSDGWKYNDAANSVLVGGAWQAAGGSAQGSGSGFTRSSYAASGAYSRPLDSGSLQGAWQQSGNADSNYTDQTASTRNADGTWTTTGSENDAGSGAASSSYSGSGSTSQSSTSGDSTNGGDSSFAGQGGESLTQNGSYQYTAASTVASDGSVTSTTTVSASGSGSGADAYSASGASDGWTNTSGNGLSSHGESHDSWGLSIVESQQSQWQQAYTTVSGPAGSVTTGSASATTQASGDATYFHNGNGSSSQTVSMGSGSGSGYGSGSGSGSGTGTSATAGSSWSSGLSGQDHYNDQVTSSRTANADGTWAAVTTTLNKVWGSGTSSWTNQGWGSLSGSGSANVWNMGGSTPTAYNMAVTAFGFFGGAGLLAGPGIVGPILPPVSGAPAGLIGPATRAGGFLAGSAWLMFTTAIPPTAEFLLNVGAGWAEANWCGVDKLLGFGPSPARTGPAQAGRFVGHVAALVQGFIEFFDVGPALEAGGGVITLASAGGAGEVGVPVAGVGVLAQVHGAVVMISSGVYIGMDLRVLMSAAPGPPPTPPASRGGAAGNPAPGPTLGEQISNGHAFDKHVIQQGEFPGVADRPGFARVIDQAIGDAKATGQVRNLSGGRTAYWDDTNGTVVIQNPGAPDGGTAFKPTGGKAYFLGLK